MADLSRFVACAGGRFPAAAWVAEWGGWRWATDMRIAVREPAGEGCGTEARPQHFPDIRGVFEGVPWESCAQPMPAFDGPLVHARCAECERLGYECPHCAGSGSAECPDCGDEHDCGKCEGRGFFPRHNCAACGGTGQVEVPGNQRIGGLLFAGKLLARIKDAFPDVRVAAMPLRGGKNNHDKHGLYFTASGGVQGVLVGMRENCWRRAGGERRRGHENARRRKRP